MKKVLNLQLDEHAELLQDIAFKSINGIKTKEILELRAIRKNDSYKYFNLIKLKSVLFLGWLGFEYNINLEIEKIVLGYIDYLVNNLPVENMDSDAQFFTNIS